MSDQYDTIAEVLGSVQAVDNSHPVAQETYDAVKAALEARAAGETVTEVTGELQELQFSGLEVGIIKPGDTLLLSTRDRVPSDALAELKRRLADELPGVKPVILDGLRVEAIYRGDSDG